MEAIHVLNHRPDHLRRDAESRRLAKTARRRTSGSSRRRRDARPDPTPPS